MYQDLMTMSNLANMMEEGTRSNAIDEDFMTMVSFSTMEIPQYANIINRVMNSPVLERADIINKLTTTKQQLKAVDKRPPKLHTAMQALIK